MAASGSSCWNSRCPRAEGCSWRTVRAKLPAMRSPPLFPSALRLLGLTALLCAAACASAPPPAPAVPANSQEAEVARAPGGLIEHIVRPQKLDPTADKYQEPQYAYRAGDTTQLS